MTAESTTREKLTEILEYRKGEYISGEELAQKLGVSRGAVWKAVKALKADGYRIDAVTNRGYCLSGDTDVLSKQGVARYLREDFAGLEDRIDLTVMREVPSTNDLLRQKAEEGAAEGTAIIAGRQTAGKGRLGRSFYSPEDTGLYISLLLRPSSLTASQAVRITTIAAVAACQAIERIADEPAGIKWVNDIYMRDRKTCGILTEGAFNIENEMLDYAVMGIGFNVYEPIDGFPEELREIAGPILTKRREDARNMLAGIFLNRFIKIYADPVGSSYAEEYKSRSIVIGRQVEIVRGSALREAAAMDIDEECRLIVKYEDGSTEALSSGEITRLRI